MSDQIHPALQREIQHYVKRGYRVVSQTPTSAQLVKPKQFSCLIATLGALLLLIGLLIYLFWYMSQKESIIYLSVDERGQVKVTKG